MPAWQRGTLVESRKPTRRDLIGYGGVGQGVTFGMTEPEELLPSIPSPQADSPLTR